MLSPARRSQPYDLALRRYDPHRLPPELRRALIMFARRQRPATDAGTYLDARWHRYSELRVACPRGEIEAFTLVQPFDAEGQHHLYVGPMFSRGGAYIELFCSMVYELLGRTDRRPFHIAVEIEHPAVLSAFNTLFPSSAGTESRALSLCTRRVALRFRDYVSHIGELDLCTLRTEIADPLFNDGSTTTPRAQLAIVSSDGSLRSCNALRAEIAFGLTALGRFVR